LGVAGRPEQHHVGEAVRASAAYHRRFASPQHRNAIRITSEGWSQDISTDIAHELRRRCDLQMRDVPYNIHEFVEQHYGLDRQLSLRLA
jgi:hypothetical protein